MVSKKPENKNVPVFSLEEGEETWGVNAETVRRFTTYALSTRKDDIAGTLKNALSERGYSENNVCIAWSIPLDEFTQLYIVCTRNGEILEVEICKSEVLYWEQLTVGSDVELQEYAQAANDYFRDIKK